MGQSQLLVETVEITSSIGRHKELAPDVKNIIEIYDQEWLFLKSRVIISFRLDDGVETAFVLACIRVSGVKHRGSQDSSRP